MADLKKGKLDQLQEDVSAHLKADPELSSVDVYTERQKDIESEIESSLGAVSKGVCVVVLTPRGRVGKPNVPGPFLDPLFIVARVIENVLVNTGDTGTKLSASYLAERVAARLHLFITSGKMTVICQELAIVPDVSNLIYDVTFKTQLGISS